MPGLYHKNLLIGLKVCSMNGILNELTLKNKWQNVMTKMCLDTKAGIQQQRNKKAKLT